MWLSVLSVLFLFTNTLFGKVVSEHFEPGTENNEDDMVYRKYMDIDEAIRKITNNGIKIILPHIMEISGQVNISSNCRRDVLRLISEIRKLKFSALSFLDASGKFSDGLFTGSVHMTGDIDQCLNASVQKNDGSIAFRGQYCMLHVRPPLLKKQERSALDKSFETLYERTKNASEIIQYLVSKSRMTYDVPMKFGLCIPSGCTTDDIEQVANHFTKMTYIDASLAFCNVAESTHFPPGRIVAICLFSLFGLLLIFGSFLDHYTKKNKMKLEGFGFNFLLSFSAVKNFPKVIDTKVLDQQLRCLSGVRVLSLFYIILLHHYFFFTRTVFEDHLLRRETEIPDFFIQIVINGFLTSDVFFFIGGLTNCYARLKANETSKRNISTLQIIIHRLWRLYPTYIFSILTVYLFYDGYGPMNTFIRENYVDKCNKNWWKNILFIDNFFDQEDTCMIQSWYIAADMQLFLLSLFVIPVLFNNATRGILLNIAVIAIGLCSAVAFAWYKGITPALILHNWDIQDGTNVWNVYVNPLPHVAPYFLGIIVGYFLYKKTDLKISKVVLCIGWIIASLMFTSMLFITKRWNAGAEYTTAESSFYFAFSRPLYALAVGWMIVCCARGYGGIINYILSLKIWIPLARISYMAYLISPTIQLFYSANIRKPSDNHNMITVWKYVGDVTISCLMSLAMVVIIESPFVALEKLLFQRKRPQKKEECHENHNGACDNPTFAVKSETTMVWEKELENQKTST